MPDFNIGQHADLKMKILLIFTGFFGIILQLYYASRLPESVANHFGLGGHANGWMSNTAHLLVNCGLFVLLSAVFLAVPVLLRKGPISLLSIPNKSYWLAPERRETSIPMIANRLLLIGVLSNIFLLFVNYLVFLANQIAPPRLNQNLFLIGLSVFLGIMILSVIALVVKLNRID